VARDLIVNAHPAAKVTLVKSRGGVFEITVDGRLVWSKKATGQFPADQDILNGLN
jgi:selenoprotein W-related protein